MSNLPAVIRQTMPTQEEIDTNYPTISSTQLTRMNLADVPSLFILFKRHPRYNYPWIIPADRVEIPSMLRNSQESDNISKDKITIHTNQALDKVHKNHKNTFDLIIDWLDYIIGTDRGYVSVDKSDYATEALVCQKSKQGIISANIWVINCWVNELSDLKIKSESYIDDNQYVRIDLMFDYFILSDYYKTMYGAKSSVYNPRAKYLNAPQLKLPYRN